MTEAAANPLGAGSDVTQAAQKIGAILRAEPTGQPRQEAAPPVQEANPQGSQPNPAAPVEVTMLKDPVTGRFVKRAEPETAEENTGPVPEGADVPDETGQPADTASEPSDTEELADTAAGLAAQLGMSEDDLLNHLKLTVKVNGEEKPANLRELRDGFQMQSDYQRKTADLAEQRKAVERQQQEYQQQREHLSSQLQPLVTQLETLVSEDNARLEKLLQDGDILEFERAKMQAAQRAAQLETAKREQGKFEEQRQREARTKLENDVAENERILGEKRPEWLKNPDHGREAISKIRAYLKAEGVPAEAADSLYDAVSLLTAEKAMKWDLLQKEKPGKLNEVKLAPKKFQRAGPAKAAEDPGKQAFRADLSRFRRSNSVKDAAAVLRSGGFARPG
jgi:hypothetical protein